VEGCEVCSDDMPETIAASLERVLIWEQRTNGRETVKELDEKVLADRLIGIYQSVMKKPPADLQLNFTGEFVG
jgi:hypothetical protein